MKNCKGRITMSGNRLHSCLAFMLDDRKENGLTKMNGSNGNFIEIDDSSFESVASITLPFEATRVVDEEYFIHLSDRFNLTIEIEVHCLADLTDIRLMIYEGQLLKETKQFEKDEKIH